MNKKETDIIIEKIRNATTSKQLKCRKILAKHKTAPLEQQDKLLEELATILNIKIKYNGKHYKLEE